MLRTMKLPRCLSCRWHQALQTSSDRPAQHPHLRSGRDGCTGRQPRQVRRRRCPSLASSAPVIDHASDLSMDADLSSSMLLGADPQTAFLNQQFVQAYVPTQQTQVYHQLAPTAPYAIYLRMDPSSSFPAVSPMWIVMLHSRTMVELRNAAAAKYPGSICLGFRASSRTTKGGSCRWR